MNQMYDFITILPSLFIGICRNYSHPLQASTMLFKADRRAALNPPLPPITREQILHGYLSELLEQSDYDLTTMVNSRFYTSYQLPF